MELVTQRYVMRPSEQSASILQNTSIVLSTSMFSENEPYCNDAWLANGSRHHYPRDCGGYVWSHDLVHGSRDVHVSQQIRFAGWLWLDTIKSGQ